MHSIFCRTAESLYSVEPIKDQMNGFSFLMNDLQSTGCAFPLSDGFVVAEGDFPVFEAFPHRPGDVFAHVLALGLRETRVNGKQELIVAGIMFLSPFLIIAGLPQQFCLPSPPSKNIFSGHKKEG